MFERIRCGPKKNSVFFSFCLVSLSLPSNPIPPLLSLLSSLASPLLTFLFPSLSLFLGFIHYLCSVSLQLVSHFLGYFWVIEFLKILVVLILLFFQSVFFCCIAMWELGKKMKEEMKRSRRLHTFIRFRYFQ
jgi:hypothetical protein